jgi:hypothetical protein
MKAGLPQGILVTHRLETSDALSKLNQSDLAYCHRRTRNAGAR